MSNEIKVTLKASVKNELYKAAWDNGQLSIDQSAQGAASGIQDIGTTAEDLEIGGVSTPGLLFIQNMDVTNFVLVGKDVSANFEELNTIPPGEVYYGRVATGVTIQLKADTAACKIQYLLLEN